MVINKLAYRVLIWILLLLCVATCSNGQHRAEGPGSRDHL